MARIAGKTAKVAALQIVRPQIASSAPIVRRNTSNAPSPRAICTYARAGHADRALDVLEQVVDLGWRHGAWLARDPDFERLRTEPRYRRIAAGI